MDSLVGDVDHAGLDSLLSGTQSRLTCASLSYLKEFYGEASLSVQFSL